jgi:hypothetical protein
MFLIGLYLGAFLALVKAYEGLLVVRPVSVEA